MQKHYKNVGIIVAVSEKYAEDIIGKIRDIPYFYDNALLMEIERIDAIEKADKQADQVIIKDSVLCCAGGYSFDEDILYILCPGSIGDTLYVAALVKAYKEKNNVQVVMLIVRENHRSIGELFPSVDGSIVSKELVDLLQAYSRKDAVWELKNYRYGFAREDYAHRIYMAEYEANNLLSGYKAAIMEVPEDVEYEKIHVNREKTVPEKYNKKAIIVMPHESSARRLPIFFWEELCGELSVDYTVYTNVKDNTETVIRGTQPVSEPLKNMVDICEQCFAVISIRTGMCDLLAFSDCNLIVLNTEYELAEKWNLKKVFQRDNLINIDCYGKFDPVILKRNIIWQLESFLRKSEAKE